MLRLLVCLSVDTLLLIFPVEKKKNFRDTKNFSLPCLRDCMMRRPSLKFFCLLHINKQKNLQRIWVCKICVLKAILFIEIEARLRFGLYVLYNRCFFWHAFGWHGWGWVWVTSRVRWPTIKNTQKYRLQWFSRYVTHDVILYNPHQTTFLVQDLPFNKVLGY